jgi:hypothetical protein
MVCMLKLRDYFVFFKEAGRGHFSCFNVTVPTNPDNGEAVEMSFPEAPYYPLSQYAMQKPWVCAFNIPGSN